MKQDDLFARIVQPDLDARAAEWLARARETAKSIAEDLGTVNIDQVRELLPPPSGVDPRIMGSVLRTADFRRIGYEKSTRKECHNRPIATFELAKGDEC